MARTFLTFAAALAACTPSPQETAMHSPSPDPGATVEGSSPTGRAAEPERAAQGPSPEPVPATENPPTADSPAAAEGRRTLSTAFVRVGPGGGLVVELRDGRVLTLRDVVMRRNDYCGVQVDGAKPGGRYCGGYAEVAAARPGAAPLPRQPDPAVSKPVE